MHPMCIISTGIRAPPLSSPPTRGPHRSWRGRLQPGRALSDRACIHHAPGIAVLQFVPHTHHIKADRGLLADLGQQEAQLVVLCAPAPAARAAVFRTLQAAIQKVVMPPMAPVGDVAPPTVERICAVVSLVSGGAAQAKGTSIPRRKCAHSPLLKRRGHRTAAAVMPPCSEASDGFLPGRIGTTHRARRTSPCHASASRGHC